MQTVGGWSDGDGGGVLVENKEISIVTLFHFGAALIKYIFPKIFIICDFFFW